MTEKIKRFLAVQAQQDSGLEPRQVRLCASTEALGRDGLIVVTRGIDLGPYRSNPVMLFNHDTSVPVARAVDVSIQNDELHVLAEFAPEGVSAKADETCGLVKSGILSGISIGFEVRDSEPIDPKNRARGRKITQSELNEISFVAVQAERNSLVTERADGEAEAQTDVAADTADTADTSLTAEPAIERAGAKFSAASKAKMDECRGHIDNAMRCLREMMDEEDRDMDEGGEEMRAATMQVTIKETFPWGTDEQRAAAAEKFRRQLALRTRAA